MENTKKALKGFSLMMLVKIVTRLADFIQNLLVIRNMDKSVFGLNLYFLTLTGLPLLITKNTFKRHCQRRKQNTPTQSIMNLSIIFNVIISLIFLSYWNYRQLITDIKIPMFICIITVFLQGIVQKRILQRTLQFQYSQLVLFQLVAVILKTGTGFCICQFSQLSQTPYYFPITTCAYYFYLVVMLKNKEQSKWKFPSRQSWKEIFALGYLTGSKIALQQIVKILVVEKSQYLITSNLVGYSTKYIFQPFEEAMGNLFPTISNIQHKKLLSISLGFIFYFTGLLAAYSILYAKDLLVFLYGPAYISVQYLLVVNVFILVFTAMTGLMQTSLTIHTDSRHIPALNILAICTLCICLLVQQSTTEIMLVVNTIVNILRWLIGLICCNIQLQVFNWKGILWCIIIWSICWVFSNIFSGILNLLIGGILFIITLAGVYREQRRRIVEMRQILRQNKSD